jgi:CheY-like chemotaxis protein
LRLPEGDPARQPISRVEQSAQNAADLTRQLLAYSGKGRFVVEPIDLSRLIEDTGALLRVIIPKAITLKLDLARPLPPCEVDATQIRQVLINLITNAADAIGEAPGTIMLATGTVVADREYLSRAWLDEELPEGLYAWMEVSDNGQGMAPETQNHMFDPFYTTKARGHGLGLSATLGIVRGHRGAIRVYSEPGRGTTIKVLLPGMGGAAVLPGAPEAVRGPRPVGGILVVDDEEAIRTFATDTLEGAGFRVFTAVDGVDALERFRARGAEIDAVLLDMTMPRMNGEDTFRELSRLRPGIRVLLSSGYNEQDATNRFAGKGLAGFLQKPYTARDLIERLRALVSR